MSNIIIKLIAVCSSTTLLFCLSLFFFTSDQIGLQFAIILISYLIIALPFSVVLDAFTSRLIRLTNKIKILLHYTMFSGSLTIMAAYVVFLLRIENDQTIFLFFVFFLIGSILFLLSEQLISRFVKKK